MSLKPKVEFGERILFRRGLSPEEYPYPFTLAVSDKAVYVTKEKHFQRESWYLDRIPFDEIERVTLKADSRWRIFAVGAGLICFGATLAAIALVPILKGEPGAHVSFVPFIFVAAGLIIPFLGSRRRVIQVEGKHETFTWRPQMWADSGLHGLFLRILRKKLNRGRIMALQNDFLEACSRAGLATESDEFEKSNEFREDLV